MGKSFPGIKWSMAQLELQFAEPDKVFVGRDDCQTVLLPYLAAPVGHVPFCRQQQQETSCKAEANLSVVAQDSDDVPAHISYHRTCAAVGIFLREERYASKELVGIIQAVEHGMATVLGRVSEDETTGDVEIQKAVVDV